MATTTKKTKKTTSNATPIVPTAPVKEEVAPQPTPTGTPEVKEEVAPQPTPTGTPEVIKEVPAVSTPVTNTVLTTVDDVASYLAAQDVSVADKLTHLSQTGPLGIRSVVSSLMAYLEEGGSDTPDRDPEYVLGKIYNVYTVIKNIISDPNSSEFKVKLDILNLFILANSGEGQAYNPLRLLRYDHLWHWSEASLRTHQELITVVTALANKADRKDMLKKINLRAVLAGEGSELTQENLDRMIRYYTD